MEVRYYATDAGRQPARDFLLSLEVRLQMQIRGDLRTLEMFGDKAPISKRPIKGHRPMWEFVIGSYRVFFVRLADVFWILGMCKKQNQDREIAACAARMQKVR